MNIYVLGPSAAKYSTLGPKEKDWEKKEIFEQFNNGFDGKPFGKTWIPIEVYEYKEKRSSLGDCASYSYAVPIFSQRAVDVLHDTLKQNGEILPYTFKNGKYYAYNVTTVVDVLDKKQSKFKYFDSSGRVMSIERIVFIPEKLVGLEIFKIPDIRKSDIYVTDSFVERVEKAKLTGFKFEKIWERS